MKIVNLTPHALNIQDEQGNIVIIAPEPTPARCSEQRVQVGSFLGIALYRTQFGEVQNLPEPQEGVIYVVSGIVRSACPNRSDLYQPGQAIRDKENNVIGCVGLSQ